MDAVPGNVAVFFSSFAMARDISSRWSLQDRRVLLQESSMAGEQRQQWLDMLGAGKERFVLVAVLGGIFGEGVDLPPHALDAVFVAGPAFPPVGMERDLLREFYESRYGRGFLYASLVPGMTRVVQAAGRLVRGPEDRGVVMLLGQRFLRRDIRALLPEDWRVSVEPSPVAAIEAFFSECGS